MYVYADNVDFILKIRPCIYKIIISYFLFLFSCAICSSILVGKMKINKPKNVICENYYKRVGFPKQNSYHSMKRQKKEIYYHLQPN